MAGDLLVLGMGGVFAVLWYLLRQKDVRQGENITELYQLHRADEQKLHDLQLELARNHYPKPELDQRFAQLDATIKSGFRELGTDIKEMTRALHDHLQQHHTGQ